MDKLIDPLTSEPAWIALIVLGLLFIFPLFFEEFFGLKPRPEMKRLSALLGLGFILMAGVVFLRQPAKSNHPAENEPFSKPADESASATISTQDSPTSDSPEEEGPACEFFFASPQSISAGETTTLQWQTSRAKTARINHGIGEVAAPSGSVTVKPLSSRLYTLSLEGETGSGACSARVSVTLPEVLADTREPEQGLETATFLCKKSHAGGFRYIPAEMTLSPQGIRWKFLETFEREVSIEWGAVEAWSCWGSTYGYKLDLTVSSPDDGGGSFKFSQADLQTLVDIFDRYAPAKNERRCRQWCAAPVETRLPLAPRYGARRSHHELEETSSPALQPRGQGCDPSSALG